MHYICYVKIADIIPYSIDKNLGQAYNDAVRSCDAEWICLRDADTMWLTHDYGHVLHHYINTYPDTWLFTCPTNRIGNKQQQYNGISEDPNIIKHRNIAYMVKKNKGAQDLHKYISGHMMMFPKWVWEKIPFPETGEILKVDNLWSRAILHAGGKIRLMEGLYIFHYYRLISGVKNTNHLNI
jgi:hypothetical protein